jgi:hypothetical protein
MSVISRSVIVSNAKQVITHGISLLREAGMTPEEVAAVVFACSMASSSSPAPSANVSSASSVAGDIATEPVAVAAAAASAPAEKRKPGRPKKERDPDAPKKELNPGLVEANAKSRKWYAEVYVPSWETRKDEWRELYGRIPVKKDAKRTRAEFPEDKPMSIPMALAMYKLLHGPSDDEKKAKKAAAASKKPAAAAAKPAAAAAPAPATEDIEPEFFTMTLDGQEYIYDELNNCWKLDADGSKGDWAGIYDPDTKMIDDTAEEPTM